jgi:formylglycine-generating enzyme required for sulfatase activity
MFTDQSRPASVSQFRLDRYEVTVGRFRAFVDAVSAADASPGWMPPAGSGKHGHLNGGSGLSNGGDGAVLYEPGWDPAWDAYLPAARGDWDAELLGERCNGEGGLPYATWTAAPGMNENRPITCASWYAAYAFCIWDGGFLPSDAEWDYAAAGGGDNQREYAWGNDDPGANASHAVYDCRWPPMLFGNNCTGVANVAPVGSLLPQNNAGAFGQLDLTGNAYEWTLDYETPDTVPCVDCASTASGTERRIRGGGFDSSASQLYNSFRLISFPQNLHPDVGVRCARMP